MGSKAVDLWSEIIAEESEHDQQLKTQVIYQRRRPPQKPPQEGNLKQLASSKENRVSFAAPAATKRTSWSRSLSTRGRVSIVVAACVDDQPQQKQPKRKGKPPVHRGKVVQLPNFEKEREYFQEVDAFELLEESPSPKHSSTWVISKPIVDIPPLASRLEKWLLSKKLNYSCGPSSTLSKIFETTPVNWEPTCMDSPNFAILKTPEKDSSSRKSSTMLTGLQDEGCADIETAVRKLSLMSTSSLLDHVFADPFVSLLTLCGQSAPCSLLEVFLKYCEPESIAKLGEGTFGEAFKAGNTVCKIVPIDGDLRVNGEVQKKSQELLEEAILSRALNDLQGNDDDAYNVCTSFIETLNLKVCQGPYDRALIKAWEEWDEKHGSENDHPKAFPEKQCYVVFVLQHGGKDLESFVLCNFDEARSLLAQVTSALAVAEAAFEFEHRDLHWGNILLSRNDSTTVKFILEGKKMFVKTFGLLISIIDFTLSRINTGEGIHFLDLSSDPYLFKGPKGDKQSETYRKMKELTEGCWQGSFPKTNVFWLIYLVDILLLKKSFERSSKNERDLRSLKKRLDKYNSAKEAIFDPFFSDLLVYDVCE